MGKERVSARSGWAGEKERAVGEAQAALTRKGLERKIKKALATFSRLCQQ